MDKIIEGVLPGIVVQVFIKDGLVGFLAVGPFSHNSQALLPNQEFLIIQAREDAFGCFGIEDVLPMFFIIRAVLEVDDAFAVFLTHRFVAMQKETPVVAVCRLNIVLLRIGGGFWVC